MPANEESPIREYVGMIWVGDNPGIRLQILARSLGEAKSKVVEEYGEGHVISLWNEDDATTAR